jgi:uncharacterized protein
LSLTNKVLGLFSKLRGYPAPLRLICFLLVLLGLWLPVAAPLYLGFGDRFSIFLIVLVYAEFIALIGFWGRYVEQQPKPYAYYGLVFSDRSGWECLKGIVFGFSCLTLLMLTQVILGWQAWQGEVQWWGAIFPGMLTALGFGFAEELLFRGWLLTELERDYGTAPAHWFSSLVYALLHFSFVQPLAVILATSVQFPGLVFLGMNLARARQVTKGRLGLAIGLHGGLVWAYYIVSTTMLLQPTQAVPEFITGIAGNPLAGILGLIFLAAIAICLKFF